MTSQSQVRTSDSVEFAEAVVTGVPAAPAQGRRRRRFRWGLHLAQLGIFAAWIGLWELTTRMEWLPTSMDVGPGRTVQFLWNAIKSGEIPHAAGATMGAVISAFALAAVIGIPLGIGLALLPWVDQALAPLMDALNATPRMVLGPLFIIVFGIGLRDKIALGFAMCFFFIFISARTGAQSADPEVVALSTALGASKWQIFRKISLPAALPAIFAGLRMTLIFAFHGVTASELLGSSDGLGYLVQQYSNQFRIAGTYSVIIVIIVIATLLNAIMRAIEKRVIRWTPPVAK